MKFFIKDFLSKCEEFTFTKEILNGKLHFLCSVLEASAVPEEWKEIIKSTIDSLKAMFSDDLVLHVANQTNLYAVQYGKVNLNILED